MPHRQFVFALPKALRVFFRHDRRLFGHVSRLIYRIIQEFYQQAAGRPIRTGVIIAHQTFGDMLRWNPHFHSNRLGRRFRRAGHLRLHTSWLETGPTLIALLVDSQATDRRFARNMLLRRRVIALLVAHKLLDRRFARNMLSWRHSGFSVDNSVRILDRGVQRSLAEYISRPAISLKKICYEPFKGRVLFHTTYSDYFKRWECQRQKSCTSSTLWTSLPSSPSISHRRGCNSFVAMVCTPRASRVTGPACLTFYSGRHQVGRAIMMTRPPPHPTGPGAQRCPQRKPTLQTRVHVGVRGPACSLGSTKSTHLSAPAAELGYG